MRTRKVTKTLVFECFGSSPYAVIVLPHLRTYNQSFKGKRIMQNLPEEELMEKEAALVAEVERLLPGFANSCRDKAEVVIIHQDAFAADYQDHEYALLGKAIKFAGLHGKEIRIIGKNRETLKGSSRPELIQ
jgi:hypothetical protein